MGDAVAYQQHRVALALGKTLDELADMAVDEFMHWVAFLEARDGAR